MTKPIDNTDYERCSWCGRKGTLTSLSAGNRCELQDDCARARLEAQAPVQLTTAQRGVLHQIAIHGEKVYNGRMRRTIKALEALGLVVAEYDMRPQTKGGGIELVQVITVRLAEK